MSVKDMLKERLEDTLTESELGKLPSGYQKIGDIIILKLKEGLPEEEIAKILLDQIPNTRSVCKYTGEIKGEFREPQVEVLAGDENMETIHKEHGCRYKFDISKIMWSKGNLKERMRLANLVEDDEVIIDMFAGIGYFSVPIGVHSKPEIVYSVEKNPVAFKYLKENVILNKIQDKIKPFNGDCSDVVPGLDVEADRVIMGILPSPKEHISAAMKVLKEGGILHYEGTSEEPEELIEEVEERVKRNFEVNNVSNVKSYAPNVYHYTLDLRF
ncbi:MAG: class I SAM-dependent methyltransferase family protein [Candidatus Aenigmatarchaeota archaeon]